MAMSIETRDQNEILKYCKKFLTFEESTYFAVEIAKWKKHHENIHKILAILLATPVGSISCELPFSALRHLKLWNHSTMNEERLSGLGMLLIHRGTDYIPEPEVIYH